ncbi:MAG: hypothetical protein WC959_00305 [Kiritimatiellales bacterium]
MDDRQGMLEFTCSVERLPNGNTLIADTSNNRILEVNPTDEIVWSSDDWTGGTGKMSNDDGLHYPNNICLMDANN